MIGTYGHRNLAGATFHHVDLTGARFEDVSLCGACFVAVDLSHVNIAEANIEGLTIGGFDILALINDELKRREKRDVPEPVIYQNQWTTRI